MERRRFTNSAVAGLLAGPLLAAKASAQGNASGPGITLLERLVVAVNAHDVSKFDEIYAAGANYVNHQTLVAAPSGVPAREAFKSYITQRIAAFPDLTRAQIFECLAYYEDHRAEIERLALPQIQEPAK